MVWGHSLFQKNARMRKIEDGNGHNSIFGVDIVTFANLQRLYPNCVAFSFLLQYNNVVFRISWGEITK